MQHIWGEGLVQSFSKSNSHFIQTAKPYMSEYHVWYLLINIHEALSHQHWRLLVPLHHAF